MIRVIDIETTGIDPAKDRLVEIASVDLLREGKIENEMRSYVAPGIPIPPEASAVHHLLDADLEGAPSYAEAIEHWKGADYYVAHNADFERGFLEADLGGSWLCTFKCALRVWPDLPSHSNQALRYRFGHVDPFGRPREVLVAHRALGDAVVTAAVFFEIAKHAAWGDLLQWSSEPPLHTVLKFGKHFGERYDAVRPDYLEWILEKSELDEATKFSARYWLNERASQ